MVSWKKKYTNFNAMLSTSVWKSQKDAAASDLYLGKNFFVFVLL